MLKDLAEYFQTQLRNDQAFDSTKKHYFYFLCHVSESSS